MIDSGILSQADKTAWNRIAIVEFALLIDFEYKKIIEFYPFYRVSKYVKIYPNTNFHFEPQMFKSQMLKMIDHKLNI